MRDDQQMSETRTSNELLAFEEKLGKFVRKDGSVAFPDRAHRSTDQYLFGEPVVIKTTTGNFTRPTRIVGEPYYTSADDVYRKGIPGYMRRCPHCGGDLDYCKDWTP